jgi:uncharacterized protein YjdB
MWSSSDTTIATVTQFGGITAVGKGTASIIVTTVVGRKVASCAVYVDAVRVTRIELDKVALYMLPGDSASIVAKVFSADPTKEPTNKTVTWTSSDTTVATVTETGAVEATGFGNATITATTEDGNLKATCLVTVSKVSVTGLLLSESEFEGVYGDELQLMVTILPDNATFPEVIWTSSDTTMATVSATGLVTIVSKDEGSAVIRATSKDNNMFWKECTVTIDKDMSGIIETVIWTGSYTITGWANPLTIANADFGALKPGDIVRWYYSSLGSNPQLQFWYADWSSTMIPDVRPSEGSEYYEFELTAEMIQKMANPAWGSGGILVQGDGNVVISKVSVITKAPVGEVLWEGNVALGNWSGSIQLAASLFVNAKVGKTLLIDVADQDPTATYWQFILKDTGWANIPGFTAGLAKEDTSKEFKITQPLLDEMQKGLIIQGYMVSITKVTLMP